MAPPPPTSSIMSPRTLHGRGSCQICRTRKTRCELPDPDVPRSLAPLSSDKACHRCKVLSLPCVVDQPHRVGRRGKGTKAIVHEPDVQCASCSTSGTPPCANPLSNRHSISHPPIDDTDDRLIATFEPSPWGARSSLDSSPTSPLVGECHRKQEDFATRYHGRALQLTAARIRWGYREHEGPQCDTLERGSSLLNLGRLATRHRVSLDLGFQQLLTFHPHLDSLDETISTYQSFPSTDATFLLAVILLVCLAPRRSEVPWDTVQQVLKFVASFRERFLLELPCSKQSLEALHILHWAAPFGYLPTEAVGLPQSVALCQGYTIMASQLLHRLRLANVSRATVATNLRLAFDSSTIWLWLSHIARRAHDALEDRELYSDPEFADAVALTSILVAEQNTELWDGALASADRARVLGRLYQCEQILRLNIVFSALQHFRSIPGLYTETTASIRTDVDTAQTALEGLSSRIGSILGGHRSRLKDVARGRLACRDIDEGLTTHIILRDAVLGIMACEVMKYPDLAEQAGGPWSSPHGQDPHPITKVMEFASRPWVILELSKRAGGPIGKGDLHDFVTLRNTGFERLLVSYASLYASDVLPLHRATATAFEACHNLAYTQAAGIALTRRPSNLLRSMPVPQWVFMMKQAAERMALLEPRCSAQSSGLTVGETCSKLAHALRGIVELRMDVLATRERDQPSDDFTNVRESFTPHPVPLQPTVEPTAAFDDIFFAALQPGMDNPYAAEGGMDLLFADILGNTSGMVELR